MKKTFIFFLVLACFLVAGVNLYAQVPPALPGDEMKDIPAEFGGAEALKKVEEAENKNTSSEQAPAQENANSRPAETTTAPAMPPSPQLPGLPPVPVPGDDIKIPKINEEKPPEKNNPEPPEINKEEKPEEKKEQGVEQVNSGSGSSGGSIFSKGDVEDKKSLADEEIQPPPIQNKIPDPEKFKQIPKTDIYKKEYDEQNQHLPKVVLESDYDNLMFVNAERGNVDALRALIDTGRDINMRNNRGETPLIKALLNGHNDATRLLIARGADSNAPGAFGITPLHVSVYMDNSDMVALLLSAGANPLITSQYGTSALDIAFERKHPLIYRMVKQKAEEERMAELTKQQMRVSREIKQNNVEAELERTEKSGQIRFRDPERRKAETKPEVKPKETETMKVEVDKEEDASVTDKIKNFIGDLISPENKEKAEKPAAAPAPVPVEEKKKETGEQIIKEVDENVKPPEPAPPPPVEVKKEEPPEMKRDEKNRLVVPGSLFSKKTAAAENNDKKAEDAKTNPADKKTPAELPAPPSAEIPTPPQPPLVPGQ